MKEKELRLGLVCFGGISLAIYMHGVTKEIWKLVRASKAYHAPADLAQRGLRGYVADNPGAPGEVDSELVYYDLLRQIGKSLDIRIVTDVIAGASAGGINGIFLARALAHDLNMDGLRELWLTEADMDRLMRKDKPAGGWVSQLARPLIRWAASSRLDQSLVTPTIARKFADSFSLGRPQPPLDGPNLLEQLFNAMAGMGSPRHGDHSLMPRQQRLDLFVTLTDFYGYDQFVPIHDPPVIREREHRHSLHFHYQRWPNGEVGTEFDDSHLPGLAFAARATASFPGAFPPARIAEVDRLMARRRETWTTRQHFLATNFAVYRQAGLDPERTVFLDGSVLNNKPFAQAMAAIRGRPAFRDVDRRIVYIEPHPEDLRLSPSGRMPSLLRTLRGALSDIPRNQPIQDELDWIRKFNERVRQLRAITDASRPQIERAVGQITAQGQEEWQDRRQRMICWRAEANARAASEAGYAYEGYARLKLDQAIRFVGTLIRDICDRPADSVEAALIPLVLEHWCRRQGVIVDGAAMPRSGPIGSDGVSIPAWVRFLAEFDVEFRRRRLRFVLRALNQMYADMTEDSPVQAEQLDALKVRLYDGLDRLRHFGEVDAVRPVAATEIRILFGRLESAPGARFEDTARKFAEQNLDDIGKVIEILSRDIDLRAVNAIVDEIFLDLEHDWPDHLCRELLLTYLGFSFWDVLTFSVYNAQDMTEYNEIRVDRISPNDAKDIEAGDIRSTIKGIALAHFGAFFRRADRENDYLWGRLHGAERLIEIVYDAARLERAGGDINLRQMKKQAFLNILDAEEKHLTLVGDLIAKLRAQITAM